MKTPFEDPAFAKMSALYESEKGLKLELERSKGTPIMSEDAMKMSIVYLKYALYYQIQMNEDLVERIANLEKKSIFRRKK
jgi:hypothetical protein